MTTTPSPPLELREATRLDPRSPHAHPPPAVEPSSVAGPARMWLAPAPPGWAFRPGDPAARPQVSCPEDAARLVLPLLDGRDRELCVLVSLDVKHRLLSVSTVSVGTAEHTFMAPREVYRDAMAAGASAIFVAHNHPSGDATPSADDRQVTRRLASAGATLGIDLLDHLVVGSPEWTSLARQGVL